MGIAVGVCECGCGKQTPIARSSDPERGRIAGRPTRYCVGHHPRPWRKRVWDTSLYDVVDLGFATPCWVWRGFKGRDGYGRSRWKGRDWPAHRRAWVELRGEIPDGYEVDHLCHEPRECDGGSGCPHRACVNPDHLQVVLPVANARRSGKAKLTMERAREIRERYAQGGVSQPQLAREFGISQSNIWFVLHDVTWKESAV